MNQRFLFEDESMIRDYQALQKTWFHKGQQRILHAYGKHQGVKLLGVLNYETGHIYCEEFVFLPPYSPKLNLIEGLWEWLKSEVINNVFYNSAKEIHKAVRGFIDLVNKVPEMVISRLCVKL